MAASGPAREPDLYAAAVDGSETVPDRGLDQSLDRWTHDVVLADGSTARVRPIVPADGQALVAFHHRQSRESVYFRFFSPRPVLSEDDVRRFTTVDGVDRMAFVAERGDVLVGIARYDRIGRSPEAEAAFFTDDQMVGRGVATILLEYLAAHAREQGVTRFLAHVLPENRRMTSVFRQAGFAVASSFADGVVEVSMDIAPTEEMATAVDRRASSAERRSVARLLEPGSVAVIGAGRSPEGIGHRVLRNLLRQPFTGPVYPVNPGTRAVAGLRAWASVEEIPDAVDLAVVAVPAPEVAAVIESCGRAGVGAVVVISAGFAETGELGRQAQDDLVATARRFGMRVLGPNCLGLVNTDPDHRLHATFAEVECLPGRVGVLSQSGTFGAVILEQAHRMGLGISSFVAVGNKADLSGNDLLQYWSEDERTDVVALYLESFGNPRRFGRNVRRVAAVKPVFAVRSGIWSKMTDALESGWLDDSTVDALLRQTGVVRVPTVKALLDVALVASTQPVPAGRGVAVVGNSGGSTAMAADTCHQAGLQLVGFAPPSLAVVDAARLHGRATANPVELAYDAGPDEYEPVLDAVCADPGVHSVLVVHAPYDRRDVSALTDLIDRVAGRHPTTTIVACVFGDHPELTAGGVPIFDFPDDAAIAIGHLTRYREWSEWERAGSFLHAPDPDALETVVDALLGDRTHIDLDPRQVRELLAVGGITTVPVQVVDDLTQLGAVETVGPVALKALGHRTGALTRQGGVALDIDDRAGLVAAGTQIAAALGPSAWPMLVQPMVPPGTEVRIAVETHPVVGSVVRIGPGGGAGRFATTAARVLPVSDRSTAELVEAAGLADLLVDGARDRLVELVQSLGAIVDAAPEVASIVCDPVIVRPDAADVIEVRASLGIPPDDDLPGVRRVGA